MWVFKGLLILVILQAVTARTCFKCTYEQGLEGTNERCENDPDPEESEVYPDSVGINLDEVLQKNSMFSNTLNRNGSNSPHESLYNYCGTLTYGLNGIKIVKRAGYVSSDMNGHNKCVDQLPRDVVVPGAYGILLCLCKGELCNKGSTHEPVVPPPTTPEPEIDFSCYRCGYPGGVPCPDKLDPNYLLNHTQFAAASLDAKIPFCYSSSFTFDGKKRQVHDGILLSTENPGVTCDSVLPKNINLNAATKIATCYCSTSKCNDNNNGLMVKNVPVLWVSAVILLLFFKSIYSLFHTSIEISFLSESMKKCHHQLDETFVTSNVPRKELQVVNDHKQGVY
ncbi:unnamed protein product [Allacma fusca]|uniref:Protein quiver n=1 Tax=Allacma fusca TaxID=39272 RepID=A0A8J2PT08_9HEXA|nr:unnamed protein product [Allacma fusca]